jgi:hypothetical protein
MLDACRTWDKWLSNDEMGMPGAFFFMRGCGETVLRRRELVVFVCK